MLIRFYGRSGQSFREIWKWIHYSDLRESSLLGSAFSERGTHILTDLATFASSCLILVRLILFAGINQKVMCMVSIMYNVIGYNINKVVARL